MLPRPTLEAFDAWLASRSLQLDAIVVGGSALALALLGVTEQDANPLWPEHVRSSLASLRQRLEHGL